MLLSLSRCFLFLLLFHVVDWIPFVSVEAIHTEILAINKRNEPQQESITVKITEEEPVILLCSFYWSGSPGDAPILYRYAAQNIGGCQKIQPLAKFIAIQMKQDLMFDTDTDTDVMTETKESSHAYSRNTIDTIMQSVHVDMMAHESGGLRKYSLTIFSRSDKSIADAFHRMKGIQLLINFATDMNHVGGTIEPTRTLSEMIQSPADSPTKSSGWRRAGKQRTKSKRNTKFTHETIHSTEAPRSIPPNTRTRKSQSGLLSILMIASVLLLAMWLVVKMLRFFGAPCFVRRIRFAATRRNVEHLESMKPYLLELGLLLERLPNDPHPFAFQLEELRPLAMKKFLQTPLVEDGLVIFLSTVPLSKRELKVQRKENSIPHVGRPRAGCGGGARSRLGNVAESRSSPSDTEDRDEG